MSGYVPVCGTDDVPEGTARRFEVDGRAIALVRSGDEWFAIDDRCSHADVALSDGEVDDDCIECWLHGSTFDLRTGKPIGPPATRPVPTYPVKIEGDRVMVAVTQEH